MLLVVFTINDYNIVSSDHVAYPPANPYNSSAARHNISPRDYKHIFDVYIYYTGITTNVYPIPTVRCTHHVVMGTVERVIIYFLLLLLFPPPPLLIDSYRGGDARRRRR